MNARKIRDASAVHLGVGENPYRIPVRITHEAKGRRSRWGGQAIAVILGLVALGCAFYAGAWVVCSSIFSAPDPLSALPVLGSLPASVAAWMQWNRSHARGLSFDVAHAAFATLIVGSVLLSLVALFAFAYGTLHPPPPLDLHFSFGGC